MKQATLLKTYRHTEAGIYHSCVEHAIFIGKGQCASEIHRAHDAKLVKYQTLSPTNSHGHFHDRGCKRLRYLSPRLHGGIATGTVIALDSNFKPPLLSRILVSKEKIWWPHVTIGINHDCVCVVGVKLFAACGLVIPQFGETTLSGIWHQQCTRKHDWSLNHTIHLVACIVSWTRFESLMWYESNKNWYLSRIKALHNNLYTFIGIYCGI